MSKRAVLYLRVASRAPANVPEPDRLAWQREAIAAAARRLDAEIVAEYVDQGYSGMNPNRPDLQRLLSDLSQLKPVYVFVADQARLARNAADHASLAHRIEQSGAVLTSALEDSDPALAGTLAGGQRTSRGGDGNTS